MPQTLESDRIVQACRLTQADFDAFADLSGDHNPIHVDPTFAADTPFGATVSHGMLLFTQLRGVIARQFPGQALTHQTLMFPAPSYAEEALTLSVSIEGEAANGGLTLRTDVVKADGRLGLQGRCVLGGTPDTPAPATSVATPYRSTGEAAPGLARFLALNPGDHAELVRQFSPTDVHAWAVLAGLDTPPAELPEPLIAALFSCLLGEDLPGHGTNYLKQSMAFLQPAQVGERLTASVSITRLRADKALVDLSTRCTGADGRLLCTGNALVLFRQ